jgi:hypothetical protein
MNSFRYRIRIMLMPVYIEFAGTLLGFDDYVSMCAMVLYLETASHIIFA